MKLRADLRPLIAGQETANLAIQEAAASNTITLDNVSDFTAGDFILIGVLGTETAELKHISSIDSNTVTLETPLGYAQPQDTLVTLLPYDQINFYHSTTVTGVLTALNVSPQDIVPDDIYNSYDDLINTTGYGWYRFFNSDFATSSELSNPVPYAGFADNSVKVMLDTFYTAIGNRERKLIRDEDVYRWMNEAYAIARNRLNLGNREYTVPTPTTINVTAGTAEYALPSYFSKVRAVTDSSGKPLVYIPYEQTPTFTANDTNEASTRYYLRGNYIGFAPTPSEAAEYLLYYTSTATVLSSYIDYFDLPNANHYFILDYLLYRATPIIGGNADFRLKAFDRGLNDLIVTSHKQNDNLDSIGIANSAVV